MTQPSRQPTQHREHGSTGASRSPRTAALAVVAIALLLVGIPFAYRLGAERQLAPPAPAVESPGSGATTPGAASPSTSPPLSGGSNEPSAVDRALEGLGLIDIFGSPLDRDCTSELISKRSDRSVTLGGRVEARDHGGWVLTCRHERGDRTRYFELASGVTDALERIGTTFEGGTSYVGEPGGTIETRWQARGDVMSGEIELLTIATEPGTLSMIVLIDLRGTWQGSPRES